MERLIVAPTAPPSSPQTGSTHDSSGAACEHHVAARMYRPPAESVSAMLNAHHIALVGASPRPGSFGERMVIEVLRSRGNREVSLVNPRHTRVADRCCLPSLDHLDTAPDLVLLGVGDDALESQLRAAADVGASSAVVFGSAHAPGLRERLADICAEAEMSLCGAGCMGFWNVGKGLRALGYVERTDLPTGPITLITHSGSMFSTMLRTDRGLGFDLAVSSGQEIVTTTADYVDHAVAAGRTRVLALILETVRDGERLRASLRNAVAQGVDVVILATGTSAAGSAMVAAHSGAIAGDFAMWDALCADVGAVRTGDLGEFTDTLELFSSPRRTAHAAGTGLAAVHDSGAERSLLVDLATELGTPVAQITEQTTERLAARLGPGLLPINPLDVWGTGHDTRELFGSCLTALSDDPGVGVTALAVDFVAEYDGDTAYADALLDAAAATDEPVVALTGLPSALDAAVAARLRGAGVPVLEGIRSGLPALAHLLDAPRRHAHAIRPRGHEVDPARAHRWRTRLTDPTPLDTIEMTTLLDDYGIDHPSTRECTSLPEVLTAATEIGWPVALKTANPEVAHKSDVGGVVLALTDEAALSRAYLTMSATLGDRVTVSSMAPSGVELSVGIVGGGPLGPLLLVAAGGVMIELLADRAAALPPVDTATAAELVGRLRIATLLPGFRGSPPVDAEALHRLIVAVSLLSTEIGDAVGAIEFNPVIVTPSGACAVDTLIVPTTMSPPPLPHHEEHTCTA